MKYGIVYINKSKLLCLYLYVNHNATKHQQNIAFNERFRQNILEMEAEWEVQFGPDP